MKKNYFLLAATTMMFAACAQTDLVNEVVTEEAPQAIGFEGFANKATRAELDDTGLQNAGFHVWGYKYDGTITWDDPAVDGNQANYFEVFTGTDVTYSEQTWKPATAKYWDDTKNYNFYAVAPKEPAENTYEINNGMIKINNVQYAENDNSNDYLVARAGATEIDGSTKRTVPFVFNHIMAKVSFKLIASVNKTITVTNLSMSGWSAATGTFTQSLTETPTTRVHGEWSYGTAADGDVQLVPNSSQTSITLDNYNGTAKAVADSYIMVPQTINYTPAASGTPEQGLTFTISYVIDGETFTDQVGVVNAQQIWGTDTHTTYIIGVGPNIIDFKGTVVGWTETDPVGDSTIQ